MCRNAARFVVVVVVVVVFAIWSGATLAQEREEAREQERAQQEAARTEALYRRDQQRRAVRTPSREYGDASAGDVEAMISRLESQMEALRLKVRAWEDGEVETPPAEERLRVRREMTVTEAQLEQLRNRRDALRNVRRPGVGEGVEGLARKLRHLRAAAENLRAAGMNDLAEQVADRAAAVEREMREVADRQPVRPVQPGGDRGEIEALRRELQQLREEVRRLRAERGSGPVAPTRPPQPER